MRVLATACDRENRGVPVAHAVVVGPDTVWFRLKTPDERPPAGWTAEPGGRTWHAELRRLQSASVTESPQEPYPQLVSLGTNSKGFVLLNLSQAGGIIGLEGDTREARALAQDWTRELTTSPWSRDVQVVRIGFKAGTADPVGSIEAQSLVDAEAALADEGGGVLLLAGLPGGRDRERVYRLADDPEGRWSVVVVGRVEHPRWRFSIDSNGVVDTGLLDEPVAHRLNSAVDTPAHEDPDADPAGHPVGAAAPGSRRPEPLSARLWIVVGGVAVACLVGIALVLTLRGSTSPSAPVAQPSAGQEVTRGAAASSPTTSTQSGSTPPANAAATLVNPGTGKCLSGSAGSDGTPLILAACDGAANQQWTVAPDGTIRTKSLCMDAAWGATAPGTVVQIGSCSGNLAQQFSLRGDTIYSTKAKMCVGEVNGGTGIALSPCDSGASELFKRG